MDCPKEVRYGCFYNANLIFKKFTFLFSNIFKTGSTTWLFVNHENMTMFSWQEYHCLSHLVVCYVACGILVSLTRDGTTFSALESGFWITRPPGKSLIWLSLILADCNTRRLRGQFLGRINMPPGWRELKGLRRQHRLPVEPKSLVLLKGRLDFSPQFLWIFHLYHFAANWQGYEPSPEHMSDKSLAPRWPGQSLF